MDHYILGGEDGHTPILEPDFMAWARWFEQASHDGAAGRRVAQTCDGDIRVSTVFLGLDHQWGSGPPLLFETMVFGGPLDSEQDRYSTWEAADEGHREMVRRVTEAMP